MKTTIAPIGAAPATAATKEPTTAPIGTAPTTARTTAPTKVLLLHRQRY